MVWLDESSKDDSFLLRCTVISPPSFEIVVQASYRLRHHGECLSHSDLFFSGERGRGSIAYKLISSLQEAAKLVDGRG